MNEQITERGGIQFQLRMELINTSFTYNGQKCFGDNLIDKKVDNIVSEYLVHKLIG